MLRGPQGLLGSKFVFGAGPEGAAGFDFAVIRFIRGNLTPLHKTNNRGGLESKSRGRCGTQARGKHGRRSFGGFQTAPLRLNLMRKKKCISRTTTETADKSSSHSCLSVTVFPIFAFSLSAFHIRVYRIYRCSSVVVSEWLRFNVAAFDRLP